MNENRLKLSTKSAPLADRLKVWESAVEATRRHINLAKVFQDAGIKYLQRLQVGETKDFIDEYHACLVNLEKGTKLERDASRELIDLYNLQPK